MKEKKIVVTHTHACGRMTAEAAAEVERKKETQYMESQYQWARGVFLDSTSAISGGGGVGGGLTHFIEIK